METMLLDESLGFDLKLPSAPLPKLLKISQMLDECLFTDQK